jgi:hypothetical protein
MPMPIARPPLAIRPEMSRATIEAANEYNRRGAHLLQAVVPDIAELDRLEIDRLRTLFDSPSLWMRLVALAAALHEAGMDSHLKSIGLPVALAKLEEIEVDPKYLLVVADLAHELPPAVTASWSNIDTISRKVLANALTTFEALLPARPGWAQPIANAFGLPIGEAVMRMANTTRTVILHRAEAAGGDAELIQQLNTWVAAAPHERCGFAQLFVAAVRPAMVLLGVLPPLGKRRP